MDEQTNTPIDYSDRLYRVYFEVMDVDDIAKDIITSYAKESAVLHKYGYEAVVNMQAIPEIVRKIVYNNIAVYQVRPSRPLNITQKET